MKFFKKNYNDIFNLSELFYNICEFERYIEAVDENEQNYDSGDEQKKVLNKNNISSANKIDHEIISLFKVYITKELKSKLNE